MEASSKQKTPLNVDEVLDNVRPLSQRDRAKLRQYSYDEPTLEEAHSRAVALVEPKPWAKYAKRVGALGRKMGMTTYYDQWGEQHAVTIIQLDECQVTQVKPEKDSNGLVGVQIGAGYKKVKNISKALFKHFERAGVPPKYTLTEFRVSEDAVLPVGFVIEAMHFRPGQLVDIQGTTKGKGFQGVMKRWGFGGAPASHGVSKTHRALGSIGITGVSRVFPGKKMPGRMGHKKRTAQALKVMKVDTELNCLLVKGAVPGPAGGYVRLKDSVKERFTEETHPPYPSYIRTPGEEVPEQVVAPPPEHDPFIYGI